MRKSSRHNTTGSSSRSWCLRRHASITLAKSSAKLSGVSCMAGLSGMIAWQQQCRHGFYFTVKIALQSEQSLTVEKIATLVFGGGRDGEIFSIQSLDQSFLHTGHRDFSPAEFLQKADADRAPIVERE